MTHSSSILYIILNMELHDFKNQFSGGNQYYKYKKKILSIPYVDRVMYYFIKLCFSYIFLGTHSLFSTKLLSPRYVLSLGCRSESCLAQILSQVIFYYVCVQGGEGYPSYCRIFSILNIILDVTGWTVFRKFHEQGVLYSSPCESVHKLLGLLTWLGELGS